MGDDEFFYGDFPTLHVSTASEWKTVVFYVGDDPRPRTTTRVTFEPVPMMRLSVNEKLYEVVDIEEHIDGGFDAFILPLEVPDALPQLAFALWC